MPKFKIVLILFLLSTNLYSQKLIGDEFPGYIINTNKDSINGTIRFTSNISNKSQCDFKKNNSNKYELYSARELSAFGIHKGRRFHSRTVELDTSTHQYFLELLVDGIVNLYILKDFGKTKYFIEKGDKIFELSNNEFDAKDEFDVSQIRSTEQYKSMLAQLFQDSEISVKNIKKSPFSQAALVNLTTEYHNNVCDSYDCIDYTQNIKSNIAVELYGAYSNSDILLSEFDKEGFSSNPSFGARVTIKPKNLFKTVEFISGFGYSKKSVDFDFTSIPNNVGLEVNELYQININYLSIPLGIRYYLNYTNKLRFYSTLNFSLNFLFDTKIFRERYYTIQNDPNYRSTIIQGAYDYNKLFNGSAAEIGCNYQFNNVSSFSLSLYYERYFPIWAGNNELFKLNQTGLKLSYRQNLRL